MGFWCYRSAKEKKTQFEMVILLALLKRKRDLRLNKRDCEFLDKLVKKQADFDLWDLYFWLSANTAVPVVESHKSTDFDPLAAIKYPKKMLINYHLVLEKEIPQKISLEPSRATIRIEKDINDLSQFSTF